MGPGPGLDVKADGGCTTAPPSVHVSGQPYTWEKDRSPEDLPVAPLPAWLLSLLQAPILHSPQTSTHVDRQLVAEGERNTTLTSLAGTMRRRGMSQEAILAALLAENERICDPPLPEDEVGVIATSISRYAPESSIGATHFPLTDVGNAERLVARHGQDLRYCHTWGAWLVWNGVRWQKDSTNRVAEKAKAAVRALYVEAANTSDDDKRRALAAHARRSESDRAIKAMVHLAQSDPAMAVTAEELDVNPWLLNVLNGTIDLRTGELRPHRRADLMTKLAPVAYDAQAAASTWEECRTASLTATRP